MNYEVREGPPRYYRPVAQCTPLGLTFHGPVAYQEVTWEVAEANRPTFIKELSDMYLIAEYCAGPFYMGWWLYERETNDGRANQSVDHRGWGWLQCEHQQDRVRNACLPLVSDPPPPAKRHRQQLAKWFAGSFPNGLRVRVRGDADEGYEVMEVCRSRPRQKRGVVRTIRGATMADQFMKRMEETTKDATDD